MSAVTLFLSVYKRVILNAACDVTATFYCNKSTGDCEAIHFINVFGHIII